MEAFKSKKHISPFDIKINPKFRIPANLSFFLTDQNVQLTRKASARTQTDKFRILPRGGESRGNGASAKNGIDQANANSYGESSNKPTYFIKKTGRDQGVQVDTRKIFDFDREVAPIVAVISTKIIEQGLLEVEQELQIENMKSKSLNYYKKNEQEAKEKYKTFVEKEIEKASAKYAMIQHLTDSKKNMATKQLQNLYDNITAPYHSQEAVSERYLRSLQSKHTSPTESELRKALKDHLLEASQRIWEKSDGYEKALDGLLISLESRAAENVLAEASKRIRPVQI